MLEAIYTAPSKTTMQTTMASPPTQDLLGIVCHPNPKQGGTMQNKVVTTATRALRGAGIGSLRFNIRGVGNSAGDKIGDTNDAIADAEAVSRAMFERFKPRGFLFIGFSFGSYVALQTAKNCPRLAGLVCIAPPVDRLDFPLILELRVPWLMIWGDADDVVPARQMKHWAERVEPKPKQVVLPQVGHFFHGQLSVLQRAIHDYVVSLPVNGAG